MFMASTSAFGQAGYVTQLNGTSTTATAAPAVPTAVQTPVPASGVSQPAIIMTQSGENVLRAGTPIALKMREALTTKGKDLKVGYRFQMEVAEPVIVNGITVIPVGSPATGEVTDIRNKGMWGKSGKINARAIYVRANGRQIRLTGQMDDKGVTGTAAVVGAIALLPVAGFFMTGTSAEIPIGNPVNAFIDEDVAFAPSGNAPTPMTVPASTAPVAAPAPAAAPVSANPGR
jgi:hypothetical protein